MERTPTTRRADCSYCGRFRQCFIASINGNIMEAFTVCRPCWTEYLVSP